MTNLTRSGPFFSFLLCSEANTQNRSGDLSWIKRLHHLVWAAGFTFLSFVADLALYFHCQKPVPPTSAKYISAFPGSCLITASGLVFAILLGAIFLQWTGETQEAEKESRIWYCVVWGLWVRRNHQMQLRLQSWPQSQMPGRPASVPRDTGYCVCVSAFCRKHLHFSECGYIFLIWISVLWMSTLDSMSVSVFCKNMYKIWLLRGRGEKTIHFTPAAVLWVLIQSGIWWDFGVVSIISVCCMVPSMFQL